MPLRTPSVTGFALLSVLALACNSLEAQVSAYIGNSVSTSNSSLSTPAHWNPAAVPLGEDWVTDNTLNDLRFNQTRVTQNFSFAAYTNQTTDSEKNIHFEFVYSGVGDQTLTFTSVSTITGAIPLRFTKNNEGVSDVSITNNLTLNSAMHLGRETTATTSDVSSIGTVSVGGTTTLNSGGLLTLSRTNGTVNLGNLEFAGGALYLTTGAGSNGSSTTEENTITVNRLHGTSGTIQANKGSTSGNLVVNGSIDGTFDGTIINGSGSVRLTKDGSSTLTLSGANTFSGTTTILGGTLALSSTGSIASSSAFTVNAGATLFKDGDLSLPDAVTIGIDGSSGQISADILTIGGDLTISVIGSYADNQWLIFDFDSVLGSFNSVTLAGSYAGSLALEDSTWSGTINDRDWTFDESSGMLTVIPEPGTLAFALGLVAIGIAAVVRRRK